MEVDLSIDEILGRVLFLCNLRRTVSATHANTMTRTTSLKSRMRCRFVCIERLDLFGEYLSAAGHCVQEKSVGWDPVATTMPAA